MTNHDHGIGAEPSWKSIEDPFTYCVGFSIDLLAGIILLYSHSCRQWALSYLLLYSFVLLLSNTALGTTCQLIGAAGLDWAESACPG